MPSSPSAETCGYANQIVLSNEEDVNHQQVYHIRNRAILACKAYLWRPNMDSSATSAIPPLLHKSAEGSLPDLKRELSRVHAYFLRFLSQTQRIPAGVLQGALQVSFRALAMVRLGFLPRTAVSSTTASFHRCLHPGRTRRPFSGCPIRSRFLHRLCALP